MPESVRTYDETHLRLYFAKIVIRLDIIVDAHALEQNIAVVGVLALLLCDQAFSDSVCDHALIPGDLCDLVIDRVAAAVADVGGHELISDEEKAADRRARGRACPLSEVHKSLVDLLDQFLPLLVHPLFPLGVPAGEELGERIAEPVDHGACAFFAGHFSELIAAHAVADAGKKDGIGPFHRLDHEQAVLIAFPDISFFGNISFYELHSSPNCKYLPVMLIMIVLVILVFLGLS